MGLSSSIRQFENDFSDPRLVAFENIDLDPAISRNKEMKSIFNAGAGIYYRTNTYYFGVSVPRLIRSDIDFEVQGDLSTEARHLYVMTGAAFPLVNNLKFTPQILFKVAENAPFDLDLNFGIDYDEKYYGAINIRTGGNNDSFAESIDLIFGFQLTERLLLGVAYDYTLSDISRYENGSIEALINYRFLKKKRQVDIINPRFF
jgi:type IX secretion system PorP/SprF family membrane protein